MQFVNNTAANNNNTNDREANADLSLSPQQTSWTRFGMNLVLRVLKFGFYLVTSLFPWGGSSQPEDPALAAQNFVSHFEELFGTYHPMILTESYAQAIQTAKRQYRFLLVYLHSDQHPNTPIFCRETLCTEVITDFVNDNFLFWGASISASEGYRISELLQATTYPFLGVLRIVDNSVTIVDRIEGLIDRDTLISRLVAVLESHGSALATARQQHEERIRNRQLREEQDAAYSEALAMDQENERRAQEEERKQREMERARQEAEQRQIMLQEKRQQELQRKRESLPSEPSPAESDLIHVRIKLPSGTHVSRRFRATDPIQLIYDFVDVSQSEINNSYELVSNFPRYVYSQREISLKEARLPPQSVLLVAFTE